MFVNRTYAGISVAKTTTTTNETTKGLIGNTWEIRKTRKYLAVTEALRLFRTNSVKE